MHVCASVHVKNTCKTLVYLDRPLRLESSCRLHTAGHCWISVCVCVYKRMYVWEAPVEKAAQQHDSSLGWFDNSYFVLVSTLACCPTWCFFFFQSKKKKREKQNCLHFMEMEKCCKSREERRCAPQPAGLHGFLVTSSSITGASVCVKLKWAWWEKKIKCVFD